MEHPSEAYGGCGSAPETLTRYRERNQLERFFSKPKHFRRIATRDNKLADNFLTIVQLASMRRLLGAHEF